MRTVFAFFGLVAILLFSSEGMAQFQPGAAQVGGQGAGGGFGGKGKKGQGGAAGDPTQGGFGGKGGKGAGGGFGQAGGGGQIGGFGQGGNFGQGGGGGQIGGFGQGGNFGQGGGGGQIGGFGGAGGFGGKGVAKTPQDANSIFDALAQGKPYFLISQSRQFSRPLTVFATEAGITNDQIFRDQFASFYAKKEQYAAVGGGGKKGGFNNLDPAMGNNGGGGNPVEQMGLLAEADFRRRDLNQDQLLNPDEMPEALRGESEKWDRDRDGLINLEEYKVYFITRLNMGNQNNNQANAITILIEEDYDRRPDVIRAGKLPTNLPRWFYDLGELDGQVHLHDWYKAGKDLTEFKEWDRDDDGLVTAEEAIFHMKANGTYVAANTGRGGMNMQAYGANGYGNGVGADYGPQQGYGPNDNSFGGGMGGPGGGKKKGGKGGAGGDMTGFGGPGGGGFGGGPGGGGFGRGGAGADGFDPSADVQFGGGKGGGKGGKGGGFGGAGGGFGGGAGGGFGGADGGAAVDPAFGGGKGGGKGGKGGGKGGKGGFGGG